MQNKEHFFTAKSVINLISWLYLVTGLAVVSSILFLLTSLDLAARVDRARRVDIALELEAQYMQALLVEYTYWDEAYEMLIEAVAPDATWIASNSGQYLLDAHDFDFSLAIKAGRQLVYLSLNEEVEGLEFEALLAAGVNTLIETSLQDEEGDGMVTGYVPVGTDIYLVALGPFKDEETKQLRHDGYLVLGKQLDAEYLEEIESFYELPGLRLAKDAQESIHFKTLRDSSNQTLGQLIWTVDRPSLSLAPKVIGVVMPFFCLTMFLTRYFLKRDHADRAAFAERLYQEATVDSLTNISNRRHFMALGQQEINLHQRKGCLLAVALFDIDHFKEINDTYGHTIGDEVLVHLTQICLSTLREADILGRLGGDEFAIVLPETPLEEAAVVVDRVRNKIEECPLIVNGNMISITISMGLAPMNDHITLGSILKQADVALYQAKEQGRNQVVLHR